MAISSELIRNIGEAVGFTLNPQEGEFPIVTCVERPGMVFNVQTAGEPGEIVDRGLYLVYLAQWANQLEKSSSLGEDREILERSLGRLRDRVRLVLGEWLGLGWEVGFDNGCIQIKNGPVRATCYMDGGRVAYYCLGNRQRTWTRSVDGAAIAAVLLAVEWWLKSCLKASPGGGGLAG